MNDIVLNLLVFGGALAITAIIFLVVNKKHKQEEQNITLFAKQKGWQFERIQERLAKGIRIIAPDWTLESISRSSGRETGPGSTDMEQKTIWFAEKPGSIILIGPRTSQVNLGAMGDMLRQQVFHAALGVDAEGVSEVKIGGSAFQAQFMVWAQEINEAEHLLTPALQSALMTWLKTPPLLKRNAKGLTIELNGVHLKKVDELKRVIQLGERLL